MREDGIQAHLQGFSTTDTYNRTTVHSSSTSDETTFIICKVNTVILLYTLKLITVELICSQICSLFLQIGETTVQGRQRSIFQKTKKLL